MLKAWSNLKYKLNYIFGISCAKLIWTEFSKLPRAVSSNRILMFIESLYRMFIESSYCMIIESRCMFIQFTLHVNRIALPNVYSITTEFLMNSYRMFIESLLHVYWITLSNVYWMNQSTEYLLNHSTECLFDHSTANFVDNSTECLLNHYTTCLQNHYQLNIQSPTECLLNHCRIFIETRYRMVIKSLLNVYWITLPNVYSITLPNVKITIFFFSERMTDNIKIGLEHFEIKKEIRILYRVNLFLIETYTLS